jgi:hypothetical protein
MQTISSRRYYLTIHQSNARIRFPYRESRDGKVPHFTRNYPNHAQEYCCCGADGIAALNAGGVTIHSDVSQAALE